MSDARRCGWCRHSVGTTSKAYVFCSEEGRQVLRDSSLSCFEREPGADDGKESESEE